jgi:hypothetical protein
VEQAAVLLLVTAVTAVLPTAAVAAQASSYWDSDLMVMQGVLDLSQTVAWVVTVLAEMVV